MNRSGPDIFNICNRAPHVVLLGAGASLAAFPNGELQGLRLPLIDNFIDTIPGLADCLSSYGIHYEHHNFEDLYSNLFDNTQLVEVREIIEGIIFRYFSQMKLPEKPTLYDHLVLSLRRGDIIVTFNWDPLLYQAFCRISMRVGKENLPDALFLHGNTGIGICTEHRPIGLSNRFANCPRCGKPLRDCRLLYPVKCKNYTQDIFIAKAWEVLGKYLKKAFMFTIFGYSAPSSDVEAVELLKRGWGRWQNRELEQIEVIDVLDGDTLRQRWDAFIHTHHYDISKDFYGSWIARHSRRSCDALWDGIMQCNPREERPIPKGASWDELDEWLKPYIEVENKVRQSA